MHADKLSPSVGDSLKAYALYQFDIAGRALGRSVGKMHIGVHEARKAIRRIRATIQLAGDRQRSDVSAADNEVKALCRRLSAARDAYILVKTVDGLLKSADDPERRAILKRLRNRFRKHHSHLISRLLATDPGLRRFRRRLSRLRRSLAFAAWNRVSTVDVECALALSVRKAEQAASQAKILETGEARHRWRRRLRRLRYQREIVESELGTSVTAGTRSSPSSSSIAKLTIKVLEATTDSLGDERDMRLLHATFLEHRTLGSHQRAQILESLRRKFAAAAASVNPSS